MNDIVKYTQEKIKESNNTLQNYEQNSQMMYAFFGLILAMSETKLRRCIDYFSSAVEEKDDESNEFLLFPSYHFEKFMSKKQFELIL